MELRTEKAADRAQMVTNSIRQMTVMDKTAVLTCPEICRKVKQFSPRA